ncbi:MAG TPA: M12 family metallo-peptidase, partial [Thermoanaerobaculaceae bacterium]|nr:M12 family metallo-peptidase [Thermoanaerobaculaceae bacterium]
MRTPARAIATLAACAALTLAASDAGALLGAPVDRDVASALSGPVRSGEHVVVPRLELGDGTVASLDLEAFDIFTPDANLVEFTAKGPRRLATPADRYFRGTVVGDLDSAVFLAIGDSLRGLVFTGGKVYALAPEHNAYAAGVADLRAAVRRIDPAELGPAPFACGAETLPVPPPERGEVSALGGPVAVQPNFTSTVYTVKLGLETDYEFYQMFGSSSGALRFIGDLTAAASVIYLRDVRTVFQIGTVHLYSTATNPWSGSYSDTLTLLYALGDYWHANYAGVSRTTVHMLSGKNLGGGIAWLGVLCSGDFGFQTCDSQGANCVTHYGGGYGLSSSLSATFSTTSPNLYWDVLCYTHEIGHNFNSPHTHCYSPPIDHCYNSESGCYSGPLCANGTSDPCNVGTIMSYCHLRPGGYANSTLTFGTTGTASQAVTDLMRNFVESKSACLLAYAAAPTVTGVSPPGGPTGGGTGVTVSGTGFQPYATVTIGGVNATSVSVVNATTITATTGAHAA